MNSIKFIYPSIVIALLISCGYDQQKPEFNNWLEQNRSTLATSINYQLDSICVLSDVLTIDTIYRSMQGPYSRSTHVELSHIKSDLIWLTGYKCEVFDAATEIKLDDEFLCHNNLNYNHPEAYPWKIKTLGSEKRIFTLTAGQTSINLPEGTGIPVKTEMGLSFFSQALNHNYNKISLDTYQKVTIYYLENNDSTNKTTPLYAQTPFVTTKIGGPNGGFNEKTSEPVTPALICGFDSTNTCHISFPSNAKYNPYRDDYGRTYNGHWHLENGQQVFTTNITNMLNLSKQERIIAMGAHVHPFAINVELWDLTFNTKLSALNVQNHRDKIGLNRIEFKTNLSIDLDTNRQYALRTYYDCRDTINKHTGMANLGLYLLE